MSKFTDFFKKIFKAKPEVKNPQPTLRLPQAMYHQMDMSADLLEKSCTQKFDTAKITSLEEYLAFLKDEKNFVRDEDIQIAREAIAAEDVQNDILNDPSLSGLADVGTTQGNTFTYVGPETISEEDAKKYLSNVGLTSTVRARFVASTIDKVVRMAVIKGEPIDFTSGPLKEIVSIFATDMADANSKITNSTKTIYGETIKAIASGFNIQNGVGSTYLALVQTPGVDGTILKTFPALEPSKVFDKEVIEKVMKHFGIAETEVDFDKIEKYFKETINPAFDMANYLKGLTPADEVDLDKVMKYFNTDKALFVTTLRNKIRAESNSLQTCDLVGFQKLLQEHGVTVDNIVKLIEERDRQTAIIEESEKSIKKNQEATETLKKLHPEFDMGADILHFTSRDWNLDIGDERKNKKYRKHISNSQNTLRNDINDVIRLTEEEVQDAITYSSFGWEYERNIGTANPDLFSSDPQRKALAEAEETRRLFAKLGKKDGYIYFPPKLEKGEVSTATGVLITAKQHELMRKVYNGLNYVPGLAEVAGIADSPVAQAKLSNKSFDDLTPEEQVSLYRLVCVNASQEKYSRRERDEYAQFISDFKAIEHAQKNITVIHRHASNVNLEQVRNGIQSNIHSAETQRTNATQAREGVIDSLVTEQTTLKNQEAEISSRCRQINSELDRGNVSYDHAQAIRITVLEAGTIASHNPAVSREDLMTIPSSRYEKVNGQSIESLTALAVSGLREADLFNGRQVNEDAVRAIITTLAKNNTEWLEKLTGDMYKSAKAIQSTLATQAQQSTPAQQAPAQPAPTQPQQSGEGEVEA